MKIGKIIKTVCKVCGRILLGVFIFVWLVVALINTTPVQSFTAAVAADYFSKQWHTTVKIGALSVTPFINAGIKDIYVEDLSKDTLLYAGYVEANLASMPSSEGITVRDVLLKDAVCHLSSKNKQFNFQFIIDYFSSDKPKQKKESKPFVLEVKDLQLKNVDFALLDYDKTYPVIKGIFATNKIVCSDINLHVKDFYMKGSDMRAQFLHLEAKERCGIALNEFKGKVKFSPKGIELRDAVVKTDDSFLDLDVSMATNTFRTYSSFIDSVYCTLDIRKGTYVNLKDACYWNQRIQNADQKVFIDAKVRGTVSDMKIDGFNADVSNTHIAANGSIVGLTDIENTFFNLNIEDISTSVEDYNSLNLGTLIPDMHLPDMLARLGTVDVMGEFQGRISEFNSSLLIGTDLGIVDLKAKAQQLNKDLTKYTADINSERVNLGHLLNNSMLGNTTLSAQAELTGTNPATMHGVLEAKMKNTYFNGSNYNELAVWGDINGYDINALVDIKDENVDFNGKCYVNYAGKPTVTLDADVAHLDLHKMNLMDFADTSTVITAKVKGGVYNLDTEQLNCDAELSDITVKTSSRRYDVNNISLITSNNGEDNVIILNSDIAEATVNGKYTFGSLGDDVAYLLGRYIPDFSAVVSDKNENQHNQKKNKDSKAVYADYNVASDVNFTAKVKNIDIIRSLFDLNVYLPKQIDISGEINKEKIFVCSLNAPHIDYSDMSVLGTDIKIAAADDRLLLDVAAKEFNVSDSLGFNNIKIISQIDSASVGVQIATVQKQDSSTNASLCLNAVIDDNGLQGNFENTSFNIQGTKININNNHIIGIANKKVSMMNFVISSAASSISVDGAISGDDVLNCRFNNVDLSLVNPFIASTGMTVEGTLNRDVVLKNILESFTFTSNLEADGLAVNDVYLGKAWLNVDNTVSQDVFNTDIKFLYQAENKDVVPLHVTGTVAPKEDNEQLDLNVNMQNFSLAIIKTFIASFVSDVSGSLSCDNLTVKGKMTSPDIHGVLHCNNAAMRVNMLNTKYSVNDDIFIDNNKISFRDFVLQDAESNKITVNGDVAHHNFSSFDINLNAVADKIKLLDTKAGNGEMYYGTAYASANVNLVGDSSMINIYGRATTEPGTSLTVPVTSKESAVENEFITFVSLDGTSDSTGNTVNKDKQESSMGYNISIDLNVNPNAKLFLPIDFTQIKGDLAATGNGDLKIEMNSDGKFSMIGEVAVDNGTFIFNMMDIMEKKFVLQEGSTLTWNGDPTAGILDVTAIYKTKASLAPILGQEKSKPVDVESIIHLTGQMTNPQPSFDINLPNTDEQTAEEVFMQIDKTNEKVILEQTVSILLTNQFYYSQGGYQTDALQSGVTSSVMGVAFSQLSGIINNMVKVVDVSLNYTSSGTGTNMSDQVDANFSKSVGKWTVEVNTSFGGLGTTSTADETSQIIGDVTATYTYNDNLNFKFFNHSNANDFTKYNISPYTQGARVTYKKDYESVSDIFKKKKKNKINNNNKSSKQSEK